jgi:hypothetical protein
MLDSSVMDQYLFNDNPYTDLTFHPNVHPDQEPSFYFHVDTDPDPSPITNNGNRRPFICRPSWPSL